MTRKQYEFIAAVLYAQLMPMRYKVKLAKALADQFAKDNPRFDRMRFLHAALYDGDSRHADEAPM